MEPKILLAQLRALFERAPDFAAHTPTSREHLAWMAQAHALVSRWNNLEGIAFRSAMDSLSLDLTFDMNVGKLFGGVQRAIADLELQVPPEAQVAFAAGEVYDFFRELNDVVARAEHSLFIVDPYLDATVFDHYLNSRRPDVSVRLLLNKYADALKAPAEK